MFKDIKSMFLRRSGFLMWQQSGFVMYTTRLLEYHRPGTSHVISKHSHQVLSINKAKFEQKDDEDTEKRKMQRPVNN